MVHLTRLGDHRKDPHRSGTPRKDQRIDFVDLGDSPRPNPAAFFVRNRIGFLFIVGL
jgi:hypothetical protein